MLAAEAMIVWSPNRKEMPAETRGKVRVVKFDPHSNDTDNFIGSDGACELSWKEANETRRLFMLYRLLHTLVMTQGIEPQTVHEAFMGIDEYRQTISSSIDGSENLE